MRNEKQKEKKAYLPPEQRHRRNMAQRRRKEKEGNAEKNAEKNNAVFRKRVKEASAPRIPRTLRTRGYYRYSSEYPGNVDGCGLRENVAPAGKRGPLGRLFVLLAAAALFCAGFITVAALLGNDGGKPVSTPAAPSENGTSSKGTVWLAVSPDDFSRLGVEEIAGLLDKREAGGVVFILKDTDGIVRMDVGTETYSGSENYIQGASAKISALGAMGYETAAYISCFADTYAANAEISAAVLADSASGGVLKDVNGTCWLNPYSVKATRYLSRLIKGAVKSGFHYVMLANVCFPYDYSMVMPYYPGMPQNAGGKNGKLVSFVNSLSSDAEYAEKILLISDLYGFNSPSNETLNKYSGNMLSAVTGGMYLDLRKESCFSDGSREQRIYGYPEGMRSVFVLDAVYEAAGCVHGGGVSCVIDDDADAGAMLEAAKTAGARDVVIM